MELTILPSFVLCAVKTYIWGIWCSVGTARIGIATTVRLKLTPANSAMPVVTRSVRGLPVANAAMIFAKRVAPATIANGSIDRRLICNFPILILENWLLLKGGLRRVLAEAR